MVVRRRTTFQQENPRKNYQLMPRDPAPRQALPRMSRAPESPIKSSEAHRRRSSIPPEPESDPGSESDSKDSPEVLPPRSVTKKSSTVAGVQRPPEIRPGGKRPPRNVSGSRDRPERPKASQDSRKQPHHKRFTYMCWGCMAVAVCIAFFWNPISSLAQGPEAELSKDQLMSRALANLQRNIDDIRAKFKEQFPSTWRELEAGITEVIRNPRRPTIFFLFSRDEDSMFCLAKMIANASKTALGSEEDLHLSPKNLGNNQGQTLVNVMSKIEKQKVVIVEHLLDIHPEAMKVFHNLCDRENPAVAEAIYILTMVVDGYKNGKPLEFVENELALKLQGKIDEEKLQPLITRLTDGSIIHVQPEPGVKSCPLRY